MIFDNSNHNNKENLDIEEDILNEEEEKEENKEVEKEENKEEVKEENKEDIQNEEEEKEDNTCLNKEDIALYKFCDEQFKMYKEKEKDNYIISQKLVYMLNNFNTYNNCSQDDIYFYNMIYNDYLREHIINLGNKISFLEYYEIIKYLKKNYKKNREHYKNISDISISTILENNKNQNKLIFTNINNEFNRKMNEIREKNEIKEIDLELGLELKKKELTRDNQINQLELEYELENYKKKINNKTQISKLDNEIELERRLNELVLKKNRIKENNKIEETLMEMELNNKINNIKRNNQIEEMMIELDIEKKKKELTTQINKNKINEMIEIYPYELYSKSCCNCIFNKKQNIINNFDKIYEIIIKIPNIQNI